MQTTRTRSIRVSQKDEAVQDDAKSNLKRKALVDLTNDAEAARAKRVAKAITTTARRVAKKDPAPAKVAPVKSAAAAVRPAATRKALQAKEKPIVKEEPVQALIDDEESESSREESPLRKPVKARSDLERLSISDLQPMLNGMQLNSPKPVLPTEAWDDIDEEDRDDPQAVVEYAEDIFRHLKKRELVDCANPSYMKSQTDISEIMRKVVVDWLVEVHLRFRVLTDTFFLAVNVMDRFLSLRQCPRSKLQLIAITSLLIACKFEEIYLPGLDDFVYICCKAFTRNQILKCEDLILQTLKYNLCNPTALHFLRRYSKASHSNSKMHALSKYLAEISLLDYGMIKYRPSEVAAASVYLSRKWTGEVPWNATLQHYTEYKEDDLKDCIADLASCVLAHGNANPSNKYAAIFKKYSSPKLGAVATIPQSQQ